MAVRPVAGRPAGDAAKADLEQLEPFALAVEAGIHEMRADGEAGGVEGLGRALAEQAAQQVEDAAERVGAAGERGRVLRLEQRAFRDPHSTRS